MGNRAKILTVVGLVLACFSLSFCMEAKKSDSESETIQQDKETVDSCAIADIDTISIDCDLQLHYLTDATRIEFKNVIINDSTALFRTQSCDQELSRTYTQVELDEKVANNFRRLLNEIYSIHESVVKSDLPEVVLGIASVKCYYTINMTLDGKRVKEHLDCFSYELTYNANLGIDPFYEQFREIRKLINEISYRMEHEFYDFDYYRIDKKRIEKNQALGRLYDPESVVEGHL